LARVIFLKISRFEGKSAHEGFFSRTFAGRDFIQDILHILIKAQINEFNRRKLRYFYGNFIRKVIIEYSESKIKTKKCLQKLKIHYEQNL
jgi:hypothetical protein